MQSEVNRIELLFLQPQRSTVAIPPLGNPVTNPPPHYWPLQAHPNWSASTPHMFTLEGRVCVSLSSEELLYSSSLFNVQYNQFSCEPRKQSSHPGQGPVWEAPRSSQAQIPWRLTFTSLPSLSQSLSELHFKGLLYIDMMIKECLSSQLFVLKCSIGVCLFRIFN